MKLTKDKLEYGLRLIEKKPSKHTTKLHKLVVLQVYTGYNHNNNRQYTYVCAKTLEGSCYPAANSTPDKPLRLDGLVGTYTLKKLKAEYDIDTNLDVPAFKNPDQWEKDKTLVNVS